MDYDALWDAFETLLSDSALNEPSNIYGRAEALDSLKFIEDDARNRPGSPEVDARITSVIQLQTHLESINKLLFDEVWESLRAHTLPPSSLRGLLNRFTHYSPGECGYSHFDYEALDVLISGTFFSDKVPDPRKALNADMLPWEASPGSVILDLVDHLPCQNDDVFYDLGSGLGSITLLVNLLTRIQTVGVEREPVYCDYALNLAEALSLDR